MTLTEIRERAIAPAFQLLPAPMNSPEAELMLLAIGLQESRFEHRHQIGGPAHSFWQAEQGGGMVHGVLRHRKTEFLAIAVSDARGIAPITDNEIYKAIEFDDVLAAALARLLLWTDPWPLPKVGECAKAWDLYLRTWRPGKPHRKTWDALYARAMDELSCSA
jgi:hypothetical protein